MISAGKQDHETLLTKQNLLRLVYESKPYTVPSLPHFALRVLVLVEHYGVKDLSFYEEDRVADAKARQGSLAKREKKGQEGTFRQAPGRSRPTTSFIARPPSKKKSTPRPTEKALDLSLPFRLFVSFNLYRGWHRSGLIQLTFCGGQLRLGA